MHKGLLVLIVLVSLSFAKKIKPTFYFHDSTYTATYALSCEASHLSQIQVMDLLFRYNHVKEYMGKFNLKIAKITENDTLSRVKLSYNYLIAKMSMEVIRNREYNGNHVDFIMENYHRTKRILPIVLYTRGDYRVEKVATGWIIHYSNKVKMDRKIGWTYQSIIKRETRQYLRELRKYVEAFNK